jgi:hypothetical protein
MLSITAGLPLPSLPSQRQQTQQAIELVTIIVENKATIHCKGINMFIIQYVAEDSIDTALLCIISQRPLFDSQLTHITAYSGTEHGGNAICRTQLMYHHRVLEHVYVH